MKKNIETLKIYQLPNPLMSTELLALLGNKYFEALSFRWEFVSDISQCDVVIWDGVINSKSARIYETMIPYIDDKKMLMLVRDSLAYPSENPMIKLIDLEKVQYVEISGWGALPEEILAALEQCYKKIKHV